MARSGFLSADDKTPYLQTIFGKACCMNNHYMILRVSEEQKLEFGALTFHSATIGFRV